MHRPLRTQERGAAVFVVVLVITLLTALGVFALRSVSLVDVAAGYDRQASQTAYLSEYAGRAVAAELGDGAASAYIDKVARGTDTCLVNTKLDPAALDPSITAPLPCYKLFINEIGNRVDKYFSGNKVLNAQDTNFAGSLGPKLDLTGAIQPMEGVFVVEMTDPADTVPNPGSPLGGNNPANQFKDVQLTLTAFAQVRPLDPNPADPWCASSSLAASASVSSLRAHVTLKNVPR
jgi:hypothetical protein